MIAAGRGRFGPAAAAGLFLACLWIGVLGIARIGPARAAAHASWTYTTDTHVVVAADATSTARHTVRLKLETAEGIAANARQTAAYIQGMEGLEVAEAYVLKPDGTRHDVPASAVTRTEGAADTASADTATLTLTFDDLSPGDTLVYTTVRTVRQTPLDGVFTYAWTFNRRLPLTRARYVVEVPARLHLNAAVVGDEVSHRTDAPDAARQRHEIVYAPTAPPPREEPGAITDLDREPSFALTTLADHAALGAAYWRTAAARTAVTPDIAALAADIVQGETDDEDRVAAVDAWLKRNIRYRAVYLGRQRWEPQAASATLVARTGDCKDFAALATALLDAVGIASEHALVNLGTAYTLGPLPPGPVNHVLVYVPAIARYIDPTATLSAFGVLALAAYDKPAIHAGRNGTRLARTPAMAADAHTTHAQTSLTVADDGSVSGETVQTATGIFAASARQMHLRHQLAGPDKALEARLAALGTPGTGRYDGRSPSELREPYAITARFTLNDRMPLPLAGSRRLPIGAPVHARAGTFLLGARLKDRQHDFPCYAGRQVEDIEITFADRLALPRVPQPRAIETNVFAFAQTARLAGRTFHIRREFTSRVPRQTCPANLEGQIEQPLRLVQEALGSVLVFGTASPLETGTLRRPKAP